MFWCITKNIYVWYHESKHEMKHIEPKPTQKNSFEDPPNHYWKLLKRIINTPEWEVSQTLLPILYPIGNYFYELANIMVLGWQVKNDSFVIVVLKMVCMFLSYLWKRYVSRPGHLPEAAHPFVEMEALMGKVFFLLCK